MTTNAPAAAGTALYGLLATAKHLHSIWLGISLKEADSGALARELETLSKLSDLIEELELRAQGHWVVVVREVPPAGGVH